MKNILQVCSSIRTRVWVCSVCVWVQPLGILTLLPCVAVCTVLCSSVLLYTGCVCSLSPCQLAVCSTNGVTVPPINTLQSWSQTTSSPQKEPRDLSGWLSGLTVKHLLIFFFYSRQWRLLFFCSTQLTVFLSFPIGGLLTPSPWWDLLGARPSLLEAPPRDTQAPSCMNRYLISLHSHPGTFSITHHLSSSLP